jgi:hypothetical protein
MGTEKYWQQEKRNIDLNKHNIHPDIKQTMEDSKAIQSLKNPKALYYDCLKGALYWRQWAQADDLSISDMATIICRDTGCELTYCQASLYDPYERPFENCEQQFRQLNRCIAQEEKRYLDNPEGRSLQEHALYMLERKRKEKYFDLTQKIEQPNELNKEREYFIKESNTNLSMKNKI